jgi:hypothetical protein
MSARSKPAKAKAKTVGGSRWKKGQSGNPGGRPKLIGHVRELAQQQTEKSIKRLVSILDDKDAPHAAVVAAARELLDRGWGKSSQPIGGASDLPPIRSVRELSEAELMAFAQQSDDANG